MLEVGSLEVESLDLEARGVARRDGKVIFIEGALTGEIVTTHTLRRKPSYEIARVEQILRESNLRVKPKCRHFGMCGGCAMQHVDASAQVAIKQRALEDGLAHIAGVKPEDIAVLYRANFHSRVIEEGFLKLGLPYQVLGT